MTNDIWNKLVDRLLDPERDEGKKIDTFMSLISIEIEVGQEKVDGMILDRRLRRTGGDSNENLDDL